MLYREKSLLARLGGGLAPLQDALEEPGRDATARGEPGLFLSAVPQKAPCCSHSQPWKYENPLCGVGTGSSVREELLFYHLGLFQSLHHTVLFFLPLAGQEQLQLLFFFIPGLLERGKDSFTPTIKPRNCRMWQGWVRQPWPST